MHVLLLTHLVGSGYKCWEWPAFYEVQDPRSSFFAMPSSVTDPLDVTQSVYAIQIRWASSDLAILETPPLPGLPSATPTTTPSRTPTETPDAKDYGSSSP